jgi:hypothetical protein
MTLVQATEVTRETLSDSDPKVQVVETARETLRDALTIHVQTAEVNREILRDALTIHVRTAEVVRETLKSLSQALFQGIECDMAEFYFNPGVFIDFSNPANRSKFHDPHPRPTDLGTTGQLPTGTAPLVYLSLPIGDSTANDFLINVSGHGTMMLISRDGHGVGYGPSPTHPSD